MKKDVKQKAASQILDIISLMAKRNANMLCKGLLYEPEIPRKLNKNEQKY